MEHEEMKKRSSEKVKQVMSLMKTLHLRTEARDRIGEGGFMEKVVFWIDEENYPQPEVASPQDNMAWFDPEGKLEVTKTPDVKQT